MTRTRKPRKSYPKAFKLEALRLMAESDRPSTEGVTQKGSRRRRGQGAEEVRSCFLPHNSRRGQV